MACAALGGPAEYPTTAAGTFGAVITLNGNDYRLVLLDTNALSEFAKQGESFRHFLTWSSAQPMRRRPDVYGRFKELFRDCPACS
jgi:hypothetical protein